MDNAINSIATAPVGQSQPDSACALIETALPLELLHHILSYLGKEELQSAVQLDHFWNVLTLDYVKRREEGLLQALIALPISESNPTPLSSQLAKVTKAIEEKKIFTCISLKEIKSHLLEQRQEALNGLNALERKELEKLPYSTRANQKPSFFENIFFVAECYNRFEAFIKADQKDMLCFVTLAEFLRNAGDQAKSFEVFQAAIHYAPDDYSRSQVLCELCEVLMKMGRLHEAFEVALTIPTRLTKKQAVTLVCREAEQKKELALLAQARKELIRLGYFPIF